MGGQALVQPRALGQQDMGSVRDLTLELQAASRYTVRESRSSRAITELTHRLSYCASQIGDTSHVDTEQKTFS